MGWLFKSEVEKELERWLKECPELEIKYTESQNICLSYLYAVNKDSLVIAGFPGDLDSVLLDVRNVENGATFVTRIVRRGTGGRGESQFLVAMPEHIQPSPHTREERYTVYPNGRFTCILTTNRGNQSLSFPVVDVSLKGCGLFNDSGVTIKIGTSLFQGMMELGQGDGLLINCQVTSLRRVRLHGEEHELLGCKFTSEREVLNALIQQARSLSRRSPRLG